MDQVIVSSEKPMETKTVLFETQEENLYYEGVLDVDPREVSQMTNEVHLIDVRQPEEFKGELGHIPGSRLLVLDNLEEQISTLPKDKPIVFVCRSGSRSARAAAYALSQGLMSVYNLKGGMLLWNDLHLPTDL